MNLDRSKLHDNRFEPMTSDEDGAPIVLDQQRRWIPREEIERDLLGFLETNEFIVPRTAFAGMSDGAVFHLWLDCINEHGLTTQYGPLPVMLVNLLEVLGYDPIGTTGIRSDVLIRLLKSWELVPDVHEPTTQ